jgi:hypothetical protein
MYRFRGLKNRNQILLPDEAKETRREVSIEVLVLGGNREVKLFQGGQNWIFKPGDKYA